MSKEIFFDPIDHSYTDSYGQIYVPVTTICKNTPRAVDFSKLPNRKAVEQARTRGTMIHAELEAFVKNGEEGITLPMQWFKNVLYPMFKDWESEVIVYSDEESCPYAGTIDLIAKYPKKERWIIIDLKNGGHETVDYQESLYKRALCKMRGLNPDDVDLACIDARDEEAIRFFQVRTIPKEWLDDLLDCCANDMPFVEPFPTLKGFDSVQMAKLAELESYISSVEANLKTLQDARDEYRKKLLLAMENVLVDTFEFGSIKVTRVKETTSESFDTKKFKEENKELYEKYKTTIRKKGYLKMTIRDATEKEKKK